MIKVKAIVEFTLEKFNELKNIERFNPDANEKGKIYVGDIFECDKEMSDYLLGENKTKKAVVEVIEVIPEKVKEEVKNELGNPIGTRKIKKTNKRKNKID